MYFEIIINKSTKFLIQRNLPHQENAEGSGCAMVSRQQIHHLGLRRNEHTCVEGQGL